MERSPRLEQFLAFTVKERGLKPESADTYREGLLRMVAFLGRDFIEGERLTVDEVRSYLRESTHAPHTRKTTLSACKRWEKWNDIEGHYVANGILSLNAPRIIEKPKAPLSLRQARALITEARGHAELRLVFFGLNGCRIGESAAMGPSNWLSDRLRFGNKGRERDLPLSADLRAMRGTLAEPRIVSHGMLQTAVESLRERLGFHFTAHHLRRTFSQTLLDRGARLEIVEYLMGHAPSSMTLRAYAGLPWRSKVEVIDLLEY